MSMHLELEVGLGGRVPAWKMQSPHQRKKNEKEFRAS
jgi:hypothetical protein